MASPRCVRLEVWSGFQCAGGTRLAVIPDALTAEDAFSVSAENQLTLTLPLGSSAHASLAARRVLRTVFADDSFNEWRILSRTQERSERGLVARVEAGDPLLALGDLIIARTEGDGTHLYQWPNEGRTASEYLSTVILPALTAEGYTWVAAGTIDPTEPVPLVFDYTTPLAALRYLAQQTGCELRLRRNGTTQYLVDIVTRVGSTAAIRYVRQGRDLLRLLREERVDAMATRVVPKGADEGGIRATMAEAEWRVATVFDILVTHYVVLEDPLGGDGPVLEDDQLNGYYLLKPGGTLQQITDTTAATQRLDMADVTGISVGDLVKIRKGSTGEVLDFLESPSQKTVAGYGLQTKVLDLPDLPGTVNLAPNPAMRTYTTGSNAPPDNWEIAPGSGLPATSVDKETGSANVETGSASAKVVTTADGHGIGTQWATIAPTATRPYLSGFIGYRNDTDGGKVRLEVLLGLGTVAISSMSRSTSGGITTVTVNTSSAHGRAVGDTMELVGVTGATTADGYNGVQRITKVVDSDTFEYQLAADPGTISLSSATVRRVWVFKTAGYPVTRQFVELGLGGNAVNAYAVSATAAKLRLVQDGATGLTLYVDRAQLTLGSGEGQRPFLEGSGPRRLWQQANLYLRDNAPPATRYDVTLVDLARLDGGTWPNEDLVLGQTLVAYDPDLPGSPVSTRVVDIRRNLLKDGEATVGLSTRPADITDALVRPVRADRWRPTQAAPGRRRFRIRVAPNKLAPASSTDAAALQYFSAGSAAVAASGPTVSAVCGGAIADELLARGARIIGLYASVQNVPTGTVTVDLMKDGSSIGSVSSTSSADLANTTLNQLIGTETYAIRATLAPAGAVTTCTLFWVELELEVDDVA